MRLTRLVTTDDLGEWWFHEPAYRAALRHYQEHGALPSWDRYRSGLSCPFCVGFWIGGLVLASATVWGDKGWWRLAAGALSLNEVAAHVAVRIGDSGGGRQHDSDDPQP